MKFSIKLKLLAGFGAALPLMGVMGAVTFNSIVSLADASSNVAHTHEVIGGVERMVSWLNTAETGQRGFVITGEDQYLQPYNIGIVEIQEELKTLKTLTHR